MGPSRPARILLVEDSASDVRLMEEALKEGKIAIDLKVVEDGEEALNYLTKQEPFTDVQNPDLTLLDLNLPKKDGREILKFRKADPALRVIPVIVLTTSKEEEDRFKCYNLNANCYISKPVDLEQFQRAIRLMEAFWFTVVCLPVKHTGANPPETPSGTVTTI